MVTCRIILLAALAAETAASHVHDQQMSQDFKLGSGARVSLRSSGSIAKPLPDVGTDGESQRAAPAGTYIALDESTDGESQRAAPAGARPQMSPTGEVKFFTIVLLLLSVNMIVCHMNHGRHGGPPGRHIVRRHPDTPPGWGPEMHEYSFRAWVTDINLWAMLTTLQPEQQCAAIIFQLEGGARELGRNLNAQQITQGGIINGQLLDPVSYLVMRLFQRFAHFQVETELIAAADFEQFH